MIEKNQGPQNSRGNEENCESAGQHGDMRTKPGHRASVRGHPAFEISETWSCYDRKASAPQNFARCDAVTGSRTLKQCLFFAMIHNKAGGFIYGTCLGCRCAYLALGSARSAVGSALLASQFRSRVRTLVRARPRRVPVFSDVTENGAREKQSGSRPVFLAPPAVGRFFV
jgi:hypothetical protein